MSGLCPISPDDDIQALFTHHDRLSRWWAFLWGAYADESELKTGPTEASPPSTDIIRLGRLEVDAPQSNLREVSLTPSD
jgi:hypothetical protein